METGKESELIGTLRAKARDIRKETLRLHGLAPETRLASSLSPIEILVALYYGGIMRFDPGNPFSDTRDRFIVSKAHGSICLYPILSDLGFFDRGALATVCQQGSLLGSIPDPAIPGYETINGSLGHGLGVACGMAIAMKNRSCENSVFVLSGDGELFEGSMWEAIMFAPAQKLDNLIFIVDHNKASMLDYLREIIDIEPLHSKLEPFGWDVTDVDGHDIEALYGCLSAAKERRNLRPKAVIAHTIKGKGVPRLETDRLSHIKALSVEEVDNLVSETP